MRMDPGMLGVVVVTPLAANPNCWPSLVRTLYCIDWCVRRVFRITWGGGDEREEGVWGPCDSLGDIFIFLVTFWRKINCWQC